MIEPVISHMDDPEVARLERMRRPTLLERVLRRRQPDLDADYARREVEEYRVSVKKCLVPEGLGEEHPMFFLDVGQNTIVILYGECLYDPNVIEVSEALFESWRSSEEFYSKFSLRRAPASGVVFRLRPEGSSFVPAVTLPGKLRFLRMQESLVIPGNSEMLLKALEQAGIIASNM